MLSIDNDAGVIFQFILCQYEAGRCFIITCQHFRVGMRVFHFMLQTRELTQNYY